MRLKFDQKNLYLQIFILELNYFVFIFFIIHVEK